MKHIVLIALLAVPSATSAMETPTAPTGGTYAADVFIESTSGRDCLDYAGEYYAGVVNYGGLSGTRLGIRVPLASYGLGVISLQALKITTGAGTTTPSGTFTWKGEGVGYQWNDSGTFSASITEVDKFSFVAEVTENYSSCTETQMISLMRTGAAE